MVLYSSIYVITLGPTISNHNKRMITLTEFPFPLNQRLSLYVISVMGVMSLQSIIEKYYEFLLKKKPIKIINVPMRLSIDGIFILLYFYIGSSNPQIRWVHFPFIHSFINAFSIHSNESHNWSKLSMTSKWLLIPTFCGSHVDIFKFTFYKVYMVLEILKFVTNCDI